MTLFCMVSTLFRVDMIPDILGFITVIPGIPVAKDNEEGGESAVGSWMFDDNPLPYTMNVSCTTCILTENMTNEWILQWL